MAVRAVSGIVVRRLTALENQRKDKWSESHGTRGMGPPMDESRAYRLLSFRGRFRPDHYSFGWVTVRDGYNARRQSIKCLLD